MSGVRQRAARFWRYQAKRFPIVFLILILLPPILSTGAVVNGAAPVGFVLTALLASLTYLLHLRMLDDFRDYHHDREHHPERPLSAGIITRPELAQIDAGVILVLIIVGLASGERAGAIVIALLVFSFLAGRDFFLGARLRRHFFAYNTLNMLQMGLLQILVYHLASAEVSLTELVLLHFLFTGTGSLIVEILRKLKLPGEDGTGKDTYTWHLGFRNSLLVHSAMFVLNIMLFALLAGRMEVSHWPKIALAAAAVAGASAICNDRLRRKSSNRVMQGGFLVTYGCLNLTLYIGTWP